MILPNQKYRLHQELDISELSKFADHRRLKFYNEKGYQCNTCGIKCDRLIYGKDRFGNLHIDLYDNDLTVMLTLGHTVPKSKGGKETSENIRPLCHICNYKEGSGFEYFIKNRDAFDKLLKGKSVVRRNGNLFQNNQRTAVIDRIFKSPKQRGKPYFGFTEGFTYNANNCILVNE